MPVNLFQYRGTVGALTNRKIISHNRSKLYSGINLLQSLPVYLLLSYIKFLIEKIILDLLSVFVNSIRFNTRYVASLLCNILYLTSVTVYTYLIWLYFIIIKQSGDIKENSGPLYNSCQSFSIFHWNLNSTYAQNFVKLSLLCACIATNHCNILCLSETFLDSGILSDDLNLDIPGYNLLSADHSANVKCGGVCIYLSKYLLL